MQMQKQTFVCSAQYYLTFTIIKNGPEETTAFIYFIVLCVTD